MAEPTTPNLNTKIEIFLGNALADAQLFLKNTAARFLNYHKTPLTCLLYSSSPPKNPNFRKSDLRKIPQDLGKIS